MGPAFHFPNLATVSLFSIKWAITFFPFSFATNRIPFSYAIMTASKTLVPPRLCHSSCRATSIAASSPPRRSHPLHYDHPRDCACSSTLCSRLSWLSSVTSRIPPQCRAPLLRHSLGRHHFPPWVSTLLPTRCSRDCPNQSSALF